MSHVEFDKDKCTDCRMCMQVCSMNKLGRVTPAAACIQIDSGRAPSTYGDMGCRVCDMTHERACVDACPVEALVYEPDRTWSGSTPSCARNAWPVWTSARMWRET